MEAAIRQISGPENAKAADSAADSGLTTGRLFVELEVAKAMEELGHPPEVILKVLDRTEMRRVAAEEIDRLVEPEE